MTKHTTHRPDDLPPAERGPEAGPTANPAAPDGPRKAYRKPVLAVHGRLPARTLAASGFDERPPFSDRNLKEGFAAVDPGAVLAKVLALPLTTWSYRGEPVRHLGPMAQDFHAAFGLGADDRHIHTLDAGGVVLAAIQGLHALVAAQARQLAAIERECAALRTELEAQAPAHAAARRADPVAH